VSVWLTIPSCRQIAEAKACFGAWRARGYRIALLRQGDPVEADLLIPTGSYLGWARSINILTREVLRRDPSCMWCVGGGDDTFPDESKTAEQIESDCLAHFMRGRKVGLGDCSFAWVDETLGVMQPIGDLQAWPGSRIDRFAGSPWMGRAWCERSYLGDGPMPSHYHHNFGDEELQEVAIKYGVFWQREDLTHRHEHALRHGTTWPAHLQAINAPEAWKQARDLFNERKRLGFPGSEVIAR
jgi:hypothetical protein